MRRPSGEVDRIIARIAGRSHGVVTRAELLAAGVSAGAVERRVRRGTLIPVHRGVYRAGHRAPSVDADYLAAVRGCGSRATLRGRAAAHLWALLRGQAPPAEVLAQSKRRLRGVSVTRSTNPDEDSTRRRGIPVTTVPRTLVDLAAVLDADELARACHEAGVRYGTTPAQVEAVLQRRPNSPGAGTLRAVMVGEVAVALSVLEQRFLRLLGTAELPAPVTNRQAGGKRVDCRWPEHRLTVELDSYRFHNSRHAWEQDRRRDREARARGDELLRFTHADVAGRPAEVIDALERRLRGASRTSGEPPAPR